MDEKKAERSRWSRAVAATIRAERAAAEKTQRQVMAETGIPKSTYLRLESGERRADADQLAAIAAACGLRLSVFFERVEARVASTPPVDELGEGLSPSSRQALEEGRAAVRDSQDPQGRARADDDDGHNGDDGAIGRTA